MRQQANKHRSERSFEPDWASRLSIRLARRVPIHLVFHVSLKQAGGPPEKIIPVPVDSKFILQPMKVSEKKMAKRGSRAAVKVQWKGQSVQDATWEYYDELKLRFPESGERTS